MIYLASPYSSPDSNVELLRYNQVSECLVHMLQKDEIAISTIVMSHHLAVDFGLRGDWDFWERIDLALLAKCDSLHVLMLDGWKESKGVLAEIEFARREKIHVAYRSPDTFEVVG